MKRRDVLLAAAGLLIAIALYPLFDRPAPAGQLPGLATKLNFDAHGPFRWIASLIALPLLLPLLLSNTLAANRFGLRRQSRRFRFDKAPLLLIALFAFLTIATNFPKLDLGHTVALSLLLTLPFLALPLHPRKLLTFAVYPLALYAYLHASYVTTAERAPRVSMFEDSHSLMPANEYLRGEQPYRDMLPAHGLLEDGFFDLLTLQIVEPQIGSTLNARFIVGCANAIALYFLVFAATASGEAALLAALFGISTGMLVPAIRVLPALIALAFALRAVRTRNARWFAGAGFFNVVQGVMSIDFAFYTLVTLIIALVRQRKGWKQAAIGIAAAAIPLFATFAIFGILDDFLRGTFVEVLSVGPVYTLGMFTPPARWRESVLLAIWCIAAIFAGAHIRCRAPRAIEPLVVIAIWMMLAAISYAERQHLYWSWLAPAFLLVGIVLLVQRRHAFAPYAIAAAILIAAPATHLTILHTFRHAHGSLDPKWQRVENVPRARGALFHEYDRKVIASVAHYLDKLPRHETFLDFTNRNLLYFLFNRDCPIRYYEVAFYETEERQREVIATLERNRHITTVLVPGPIGAYPVDGIPNRERAPLVWQYIERNFRPDFAEGDVVFWRREASGGRAHGPGPVWKAQPPRHGVAEAGPASGVRGRWPRPPEAPRRSGSIPRDDHHCPRRGRAAACFAAWPFRRVPRRAPSVRPLPGRARARVSSRRQR